MLKGLTKNDTLVTPYIATKDWQLSNTTNEDTVLAENGNSVSIESIKYTNDNATSVLASNCSVAIEKQSLDLATLREGLKISGLFYPNLDPINNDGTYKRLVYSQISNMFYNRYRDPTKIWGTEQIDFDTSQTKKYLSDLFKLLDIPTEIFGEKIVEGSVEIIDDTLDDATTITDDGFNNLFAGPNLFSKQEILGNHPNIFLSGSDSTCGDYFNFNPPVVPTLSGFLTNNITASLSWSMSSNVPTWNGFTLEKSTDGINYLVFSMPGSTVFNATDYINTSSIFYYKISSFNSFGSSNFSNIVELSSNTLNITSSLSGSFPAAVQLSWSFVSSGNNVNGFLLEKSVDSGSTFTLLQNITSSAVFSYADTNVTTSVNYAYRIRSYNGIISSSLSNVTTIMPGWMLYTLSNNTVVDTGHTLPVNLGQSAIGVFSNKIYLFGGFQVGGASPTAFTASIYTASVDTPFNVGDSGRILPKAIGAASLLEVSGTLYLFGGSFTFNSNLTASDVIYTASVSDPLTWGDSNARLPIGFWASPAMIVGNKIWIISGITTGGPAIPSLTASISNPLVWGIAQTESFATVQHSLMQVGGKIYRYGGTTFGEPAFQPSSKIYSASVSDPLIWGIATSTSIPGGWRPVVGVSNQWFNLGGYAGGTNTSAEVDVFTSGSPVTPVGSGFSLPSGDMYHMACVFTNSLHSGSMYIYGGGAGDSSVARNYIWSSSIKSQYVTDTSSVAPFKDNPPYYTLTIAPIA